MHTIHGNLLSMLFTKVHITMYVHTYVCIQPRSYIYVHITYVYSYYVHTFVIPVAPSVTEAVATLVTPNENRTEHSITVTCTVHPESDADMCVVMALADGRMTRSGKQLCTKCMAILLTLYSYAHLYICITYFTSQNCIHVELT